MSVFNDYARYYDLLYQDKDYEGEAAYVVKQLKHYFPDAISLLELGSGTGKHADLFARAGYELVGVESSEEMVYQARKRNPNITFHHGDLREITMGRVFDVALALFHVISYQTTNQDLLEAFKAARLHVKDGGGIIFDCWHGPAVLHQRPEVRVKRLEGQGMSVIRIAEPELDTAHSTVTVNYQMLVQENSQRYEIKEKHKMRYLFQPELEMILEISGFHLVHSEEWMTGREPGSDTWGVLHIARAI